MFEPLERRHLLAGDLVGQWIAGDLDKVLADGQVISEWNDATFDIAAMANGSPRLIQGIMDGHSVVRFDASDGTDSFTISSAVSPMSKIDDFSIAVVFATETHDLVGASRDWSFNTGLVTALTIGNTRTWGLVLSEEAKFGAGLGGPQRTVVSETDGLNDGAAHVAIFTRKGGTLSLYVDGNPPTVVEGASTEPRAAIDILIGSHIIGLFPYSGDLAELRMYNGALTPAEINLLRIELQARYASAPPLVEDDVFQVNEDTQLQVGVDEGVSSNDLDLDDDSFTVTAVKQPRHGTLNLVSDGSFTYVPEPNFFGKDDFSYRADDGQISELASVLIEVLPVDDQGVAVPDRYLVDASNTTLIHAREGVLANDQNMDGLPLQAILVNNATSGNVLLQEDGSFVYTPGSLIGTDTFDYLLRDSLGDNNTVTVTLTVDNSPQALSDKYEVLEESILQIPARRGVLVNDTDVESDPLKAVLVAQPAHGLLNLRHDGAFEYIPDFDFSGSDRFAYQASDGDQLSEAVVVNLTVVGVNDPPVANADQYFVTPGNELSTTAEKSVLRNDFDRDSALLTVSLAEEPNHGTFRLNDDGTFVYQPEFGFEGVDRFSYVTNDSQDQSVPTTVSLLVTSQQLAISEFMATNNGSVLDYYDDSPDWIEIANLDSTPFDLQGWYLTDDPDNLTKWQVPEATIVQPQQRLTVFASGRDKRAGNDELHTNFRLAAGGEYLGLVRPDGQTIAWDFDAEYVAQLTDVSSGVSTGTLTTRLVTPGTASHVLIPQNGELGNTWIASDFDDSDWSVRSNTIGFSMQGPDVIMPGLTARMVSVSGGSLEFIRNVVEAEAVLDRTISPSDYDVVTETMQVVPFVNFGDREETFADNIPYPDGSLKTTPANFTVQATSTVTIPPGDWSIGFGSVDGGILRLAGVSFSDTFGERGDLVEGDGELMYRNLRRHGWTWGNFTVGPAGLTTQLESFFFERPSDNSFELAIAPGHIKDTPTPDNWVLLANDALGWSVQTIFTPPIPEYRDLIVTDVQQQMYDRRTSAYLRVPLNVFNPSAIHRMILKMRYDDAFVAYLNGQEVARSNISIQPTWDATADTEKTDSDGLWEETFDISQHLGLLHRGDNLLAIHGLNADSTSTGFLVAPTLEVVQTLPNSMTFMDSPSAGEANDDGLPAALTSVPQFSRTGGYFTDDISLELTIGQIGAAIHYTTDGSLPTLTSPIYSKPLHIDSTTQVRARAFLPNHISSPINSESYVKLAEDVRDFTSNLPLLVVDTFQNGINGTEFANSFTAVSETKDNHRSSFTNKPDVVSRSGIKFRGSSSEGFPKRPYSLELHRDDSEQDRSIALLGMAADADWVLQGPYTYDRSLNRNALIYELSNQVGRHASQTRYVEVFVNTNDDQLAADDYMGIYLLIEKINRGTERVDVEKLSSKFTEEPEISGGYIIKIDRRDPGDRGFRAGGVICATCLSYVDPKEAEILQRPEQEAYLNNYIDQFAEALYDPTFTHPTLGLHYGQWIDIQSWVDHHLLNELMLNVDALRLSAYLHKPKGGKLAAGPLWDFDRSAGSADNRDNNPTRWYMDVEAVPRWWNRIFNDLEFRQSYIDRWQQWRQRPLSLENIFVTMDGLASQLREAVDRNFVRWPEVAPRDVNFIEPGFLDGTFDGEIQHQKEWFRQRIAWLDSLFLARPTLSHPGGSIDTGISLSITVPEGATVYYTLDGSDPRLLGGEISPSALHYTGEIDITTDSLVTARSFDPDYNVPISDFKVEVNDFEAWSGPATAIFDFLSPAADHLRVTEINFNPPGNDDAEFIELQNISVSELIDLSNVRITDGFNRVFNFSDISVTSLAPKQYVLLVNNRAAFETLYPGVSDKIAGEYDGGLSNAGETITLVDDSDHIIQQFTYDDGWYPRTDGDGMSLEVVDPTATDLSLWNKSEGWRSSSQVGGTPGTAGERGDFDGNQTVDVDDIDLLTEEIRAETHSSSFDLTFDGRVDRADIDELVLNILQTHYGDADLNGTVDQLDFQHLAANFGLSEASWRSGDFDGDHDVDFRDFNLLTNNFMADVLPENRPVAEFDRYEGPPDAPLIIDLEQGVLANDTDPEGADGSLSATVAALPTYGQVQVNSDGSFAYSPDPGFRGVDRFMYTAKGVSGNSVPASVEVTVGEPNPQDAPTDSVVTINEIMYHATGGQAELQWLELVNQMGVDVDISGWSLGGNIHYAFPNGTIIPGDGYVVVATGPDLPSLNGSSTLLGPFIGKLSHFRGRIDLINNSDRLMDRIDYSDRSPWPTGPDGSGATLAKLKPHSSSVPAENWVTSEQIGGTPGERNFPPAPVQTRKTLIEFGSDWTYDDSGTDLGTEWSGLDFDNENWPVATAPLGITSATLERLPLDQQVLLADPLAYWRLGDAGPEVVDATGRGHDGKGNIPRTRFRQEGLVVDEADDTSVRAIGSRRIVIPAFEKFPESSTGYSVEYWVVVNREPTQPIHSIVSDGEDENDFFLMNYLADLRIRPHFKGAGTEFIDSQQQLEIGIPYHVVTTWDQTTGMASIFINGKLDSSAFVGTGSPVNTDNQLFIGQDNRVKGIDFTLDEVAIYNAPLSIGQIKNHYRLGTGIEVASLTIDAPTHFLRKSFEFAGSPELSDLVLSPRIADGAIYFLNGQRLYSQNMPDDVVRFSTAATETVAEPERQGDVFLTGDLLRRGQNVLAVELHRAADQNDAELDVHLAVVETPPPATPNKSILLNELPSGAEDTFWVELVNRTTHSLSIDGMVLSINANAESEIVLPDQTLDAGEQIKFELSDAEANDRVFLYSRDRAQVLDAQAVTNRRQARSSDHDGRWLYPVNATPGEENAFAIPDFVVINEIMYHQRTTPATLNTPPRDDDEEWIELVNRSATETIDLAGWSLSSGIDFTFDKGTELGPGEYLVVARDPEALLDQHPDLSRQQVKGPFARRLSNSGDIIVLRDQNQNVVDEVHYQQAGRWAEFADGGGSSLELRDPFADNRIPESWQASNEASRSQWVTVSYEGLGALAKPFDPDRFNEFIFGLLDAGEMLIDDIRVIENPGTEQERRLIQNGSFQDDPLGAVPAKWRIIGTQAGTVVTDPDDQTNQVLHLVASGPTEHMHNQASTTLKSGDEFVTTDEESRYRIRLRAKWLAGSNRLHTRLYFNRLPRTTVLDVPNQSGTPGQRNSTWQENTGPTFTDLSHYPAVPFAQQEVTVSVSVDDPQGVADVTLFHAANQMPLAQLPMSDVGQGRYVATIGGYPEGTTVQFYVQAQDTRGEISTFPSTGPESHALFAVNQGEASQLAHNVRIIMTQADTDRLHSVTNTMSNHRIGATVVYDESEIYYDIGVRLKGSEHGRNDDNRVGFKLRFDPTQAFRGRHRTVDIDRSRPQEIVVKHTLSHAGQIPVSYDDLIQVIAPRDIHNGSAMLIMAGLRGTFLDSQYENGSDGRTFEYELYYYPVNTVDDDVEGLKTPKPDGIIGTRLQDLGDDKELYRWHFLIKNNRDEDDYGQLVRALAAVGLAEGDEFFAQTDQLLDVDQWLRAIAAMTLMGVGDNYPTNATHNAQFYIRPRDGKMILLPWDMDGVGGIGQSLPLEANDDLANLLRDPGHVHAYYGHLHDILTTTYNPEYLGHWIEHYRGFVSDKFFDVRPFGKPTDLLEYVTKRTDVALSRLPDKVTPVDFSVTSPRVVDVGSQPFATVHGNGWVNVREIRVAGASKALTLNWLTNNRWEAKIPVQAGTQTIQLLAHDFQGQQIGADSITVSSTATNPVAASLRVTELNFNPGPAVVQAGEDNVGNDRFEFVELTNLGPDPINLDGAQFVQVEVNGNMEGIRFAFDEQFLQPGELVVIVRDRMAFSSRYGYGAPIAAGNDQSGPEGHYGGRLSNAGELLTLVDANGNTIQSFQYDDSWYTSADGKGSSLVIVSQDETDSNLWNRVENWRPSNTANGTPGH